MYTPKGKTHQGGYDDDEICKGMERGAWSLLAEERTRGSSKASGQDCRRKGGGIDMTDPYKDYYEASIRDDEWAGVAQDKARQRIKKVQEIASWNGCSEEEVINEIGE